MGGQGPTATLRWDIHAALEVLEAGVGTHVRHAEPVASPVPLNGLIFAEGEHGIRRRTRSTTSPVSTFF
jgi:hypothetical protein